MKKITRYLPGGMTCLVLVLVIFGYFSYVMGFTNMLNTIMHTAHDLLLNTVFYLMGMCVVTSALGKILSEFGVVGLLQKMLKPVMRPIYNLPGVASLGAIMTFISDNPAIISLSKNRRFASYFKKYQFISMANFGTAFGMGLLVIVFMMGQGYFLEPFVGLFGAAMGGVIATRLMQHFILKRYPEFRDEDVIPAEEREQERQREEQQKALSKESQDSTFVRVLNALLDGGKDGVSIGLAIIPGVLIISTLVMMLTFGGSVEGVDKLGNDIVVYTGGAYQGTALLPWIADKLDFLFNWLFGFSAPELLSFPITALGAVGAALGLIPEFSSKGIIDGNAIAVFTAMGMCWSGFLSTHTAMLDTMGYRQLCSKDFLSQTLGGIGAGVIAHWLYVGVVAVVSMFSPSAQWTTPVNAYAAQEQNQSFQVELTAYSDSTYVVKDWYGEKGCDLKFSINRNDSTINVLNSYADKNKELYFVRISKDNHRNEPAYAVLYPTRQYSEVVMHPDSGYLYVFAFIYDGEKRPLTRGYYDLVWGNAPHLTVEAEKVIQKEIDNERSAAVLEADSIIQKQLVDSIINSKHPM